MEVRQRLSLRALIAGRCPRCRQGSIFRPLFSNQALAMNAACPVCEMRFERESGYFTGAMYVSYTLGVILIVPLAVVLALLGVPTAIVLTIAFVQALLSFGLSYRYGRIIWLHLDQALDPR